MDRLDRWYRPGLLCIGDAAHAMSPAGGVGINPAIRDAVAAARMLRPTFRSGGPTTDDLRRVQRRQELPTRITQTFQLKVPRDLHPPDRADAGPGPGRGDGDPVVFRLMRRFPPLRHLTGRFIGLGIRPEHMRLEGRGPALIPSRRPSNQPAGRARLSVTAVNGRRGHDRLEREDHAVVVGAPVQGGGEVGDQGRPASASGRSRTSPSGELAVSPRSVPLPREPGGRDDDAGMGVAHSGDRTAADPAWRPVRLRADHAAHVTAPSALTAALVQLAVD